MRTMAKIGAVALAALVPAWGGASAQGPDGEAAMVAAGEWVRGQLPAGALRLDPHRTGQGVERAVVTRVAGALGAELGTLEATRTCRDVTDPSTCRLASAALVAIAPPSIRGDAATVRVYAWYRQDDPRSPVAKRTFDVTLRRAAAGWVVD